MNDHVRFSVQGPFSMPPNFAEKSFMNSHQTLKFAKVFSLKVSLFFKASPKLLHIESDGCLHYEGQMP